MHFNILDRIVNEDEMEENDRDEDREVIVMNQAVDQLLRRAVEGRLLLYCTTSCRPTITVEHTTITFQMDKIGQGNTVQDKTRQDATAHGNP